MLSDPNVLLRSHLGGSKLYTYYIFGAFSEKKTFSSKTNSNMLTKICVNDHGFNFLYFNDVNSSEFFKVISKITKTMF